MKKKGPKEMRKEKRIFQHRLVDRFPAIMAVILTFVSVAGLQLLSAVISYPFELAMPSLGEGNFVGVIIASLFFLWLYKRWFYPEFEGNLRGGDVKTGVRLACIVLIYWAIVFPIQFMFTDSVFGWPTIGSLNLSLFAGFTEEIAFRGFPVSLLMRQWRDEKRILTVAILTSVIFGLIHITNLAAGADFGSTIFQVVTSICMGLFFCGIYLRSGNLWITIAIHALHDLLCFLDVGGIHDGVVVQSINWFSYVDLGTSIVLGVLGLWMIRKSKCAEIRRLWDRKWNMKGEMNDEII